MSKLYTIGDASRVLGMPASTIRFYDKNGLLPHMGRTESGIRMFTEDDLEWVRFIERRKTSGMPLKEIKRYITCTWRETLPSRSVWPLSWRDVTRSTVS